MRSFLIMVVIVAAVGGGLWYVGAINVPGVPSPGASAAKEKTTATELKPPRDAAPAGPEKEKTRAEPKAAEAPKSAPRPEARHTAPPVTAEDLARAEALWTKGDLGGVTRALAGVSAPGAGATPLEGQAWKLVQRVRLVQPLLAKVARSPLLSAEIEAVSLATGGQLWGKVEDQGEKVKIVAVGGAETVVDRDDVGKREKVTKDAFRSRLRDRFKEKVQRAKGPQDALGHFRLAFYCWTYGLEPDAMPHLASALDDDAFPTVALVFGGDKGNEVSDAWYEYSGRARPSASSRTPEPSRTAEPSRPAAPRPTSEPVAATQGSGALAKARALYDRAVARYRISFTDSRDAEAAVRDSRKLLSEALAVLEGQEGAAADDLRLSISRLLADCRKHQGM